MYRVFFHFCASGETVKSTEPLDLPQQSLMANLVEQLSDADDYVGLLDVDDRVLQIQCVTPGERFRVEIMPPNSRRVFTREFSVSELADFLERAPRQFKPERLEGFEPTN